MIITFISSGGPSIPFRGGRIDAAAPNAPGVPQPQEDLATHTATFKRQGFSKTEMIGLVACGCVFRLFFLFRGDGGEVWFGGFIHFRRGSVSFPR
jgi:hypothetical protein